MQLEKDKLEIVFLKGNEITDDLFELTNKQAGLMMYWMKEHRSKMAGVVIRFDGKAIAWSAYVKDETVYSMGTFVSLDFRQCGLGKLAMHKAIEMIKNECPQAWVRFGGSLHKEFNNTYEKQVLSCGLKPANIYGMYPQIDKAA